MIDKIRKQGADDIVEKVINLQIEAMEYNIHGLSDKYAKAVTTPFADLRALERRHDEMKRLLVEIIQTFDSQLYSDVQNTDNPVGFLRSKIDNLLNKGE